MGRYAESQVYSVGSGTAVEVSVGEGGVYPINRRKNFFIENSGENIVYLGDENVTSADGFPLAPQSAEVNSRLCLGDFTGTLWAITGTGTSEIRTLEVS